jgi:hypothetical protein
MTCSSQYLRTEISTFSPHGEERGHCPRVSNHGRGRGVARAASFETAGKSRPPQDEEASSLLNQSTTLSQGGNPMINPATMSRRALLSGTGAALAAAPAGPVLADWEPSQRYPDPAIEVLDPKFERLHIFSTAVERLATGMRWCEGPVWFGDGRYLLWSDIPNNRIMKFEESTGQVSVFRQPSNYTNGNCRDRAGRLISCEHGTRRISRTEYDGSITTVADRYDGKRLSTRPTT